MTIAQKYVDRFWSRVRIGDRCWEWSGFRLPGKWKYGRMKVNNRHVLAHRLSWLINRGPIPPGQYVLHKCDNPPCVRPSHLYLGSQKQNARDRDSRGRTGDTKGTKNPAAKLTERDVLAIRARHDAGESKSALARSFGVSWRAIDFVISGHHWRHVG